MSNYDPDNGKKEQPLEPFPVNRKRPERRTERPRAAKKSASEPHSHQAAPEAAPAPHHPRKQSALGRWGKTFIIVAACLCFSFFLAFFGINVAADLFGLNQPDRQVEVTIPKGTSTMGIGRILGQQDVIDHPLIFSIYAGLKKNDMPFQAGTYIFNTNQAYDEIFVNMRKGNSKKDVVRLTFYEGMSQREIGKLLEEKEVCTAAEFNEYLESAELDYEFIQMLPEDSGAFRRFEGFLFPDTYDFFVGENVASVAKKFLSRFQQMMTPELLDRMKEMNMTLEETITLASIIQEECSDASQMKNVSSVFHNRLNDPASFPKLQSDVTIFYVNKDIKPYLNKQDQKLYDSYNTYECKGLPVGPISNPGMQAIEAALYPEKTNYNFFLTDSKGKFYYAVTFEEHVRNVRAAAAVGGESHGINTK